MNRKYSDQGNGKQALDFQLLSSPRPLRALLALLPQYPPTVAAAIALNLWLGKFVSGAALPAACSKVVTIAMPDVGLRLTFAIEHDGIVACSNTPPDVTIRAAARDFLALALRREDPDTLFFSRRLIIEGDTELGLLLKNTLDALDSNAFGFRLPTPARVLKSLRLQFPLRLRPKMPDRGSVTWDR